jgi:hypothetical protein
VGWCADEGQGLVGSRERHVGRWSEVGIAAAVYFVLTVVLTWPLVHDLDTRVLGAPGSDNYGHVWLSWICRGALLDSGMLPFGLTTDRLWWPDGGSLHASDPLGCLIGLPLQLLVGPVVTYNVLVLAYLWFGAMAMFELARRATGNAHAAFVGGLAFGFSPFVLAEANNGASELLTVGWLPVLVLLLARVASKPGWSGIVPAAAVMCVLALHTWYYGILACLILATHGVFPLDLGGGAPQRMRVRLRKHAMVLAVFALGIAPFLLIFMDSMSATDALVYGGTRHKFHSLLHPYGSVDPTALLNPFAASFQVNSFCLPSYLGGASLLFALVGLAARPRVRRFWVVIGLLSLVFALGPVLVVDAQHVAVGTHPVWLPFALLGKLVPPLASLHFPRRLLVGAILASCFLSAVGVSVLLTAVPRGWRLPTVGLCVALLAADLFIPRNAPVPIPTAPTTVAPVYERLASLPDSGAVLVAPVLPEVRHLELLYWQTVHGRALQVGMPWVEVEPRFSSVPMRELLLVRWLAPADSADATEGFVPRPPEPSLRSDVSQLTDLGFTHLVVHSHEYTPSRGAAVVQTLDQLLGAGDRSDFPFILYTLPSPQR